MAMDAPTMTGQVLRDIRVWAEGMAAEAILTGTYNISPGTTKYVALLIQAMQIPLS
jgi:hypothetical protein